MRRMSSVFAKIQHGTHRIRVRKDISPPHVPANEHPARVCGVFAYFVAVRVCTRAYAVYGINVYVLNPPYARLGVSVNGSTVT